MTPEEQARKMFEPHDDVDMGDPGAKGPSEEEVAEAIRTALKDGMLAAAEIAEWGGDYETVAKNIRRRAEEI